LGVLRKRKKVLQANFAQQKNILAQTKDKPKPETEYQLEETRIELCLIIALEFYFTTAETRKKLRLPILQIESIINRLAAEETRFNFDQRKLSSWSSRANFRETTMINLVLFLKASFD